MRTQNQPSVERRLFEAYTHGRGVRLSIYDVDVLIRDDAIASRITNAACVDAGIGEIGADEASKAVDGETWQEFQRRLRKGGG